MQRKDGRNEMDELKGKEEQDEQERRVEAKKDKKGGDEMNGLKRKEEVNELDGNIETKGREVTKRTP